MTGTRDAAGGNAPPGRGKGGGPTVLIIDDDNVGRALLIEVLKESCERIIELSSPIGATRIVSQERVDVVVLDVQMPNLRGDALAKLFRSNPRIAHLGVILVSGYNDNELSELGRACGADQVISKRHIRATLVGAVHSAWMLSRERREPTQRTPEPVARTARDGTER